MISILLALTLTMTPPSNKADSLCLPITDMPANVGTVRVYGTKRGSTDEILLAEVPATDGTRLTVPISLPDSTAVWTLKVLAVSKSGVPSRCPVYMGVNLTASVPSSVTVVNTTVWYDVMGRKYTKRPTTPGLYLQTTGIYRRKLVVIH